MRRALTALVLAVGLLSAGTALAAPATAASTGGCRYDPIRYDHGLLVLWQRSCYINYTEYETRNYGLRDGRRYQLCKWPLTAAAPYCTAWRWTPYYYYHA